MGFFDFITKSPIGGILKTLAPIVSSAIPVVGPVINAALPALDGILSHDSTQTPDFAKPPPPPDQPPSPPFKLEDLLKPITTQFQATETLIKGVQESVDNLSQEMKTGFTKVESHIDAAITAAQQKQEIRDDHKTNMSLVNKITIAQKWIDNNGDALSKMTPKSGDSVFDQFLKSGEPEYLPLARKQLYSEVIIPLQQQLSTRPYLETVDTYLLALHWLLILDKALIVMHGYRARNLYVYQRWQLYLDSLLKLSNAIGKLREDANEAIQTLSKLVATVQTGRANKIRFPKVAEKAFIQDDWPMLTIGYVHIPDFEAKDELLPKLSTNYDANATTAQYATYLLYREAAEHALRIHLEPVKAVITDLCNLVPVWNSRLPPAPKVDKQINHVEILNSSNEKPSPSGAKISFAVTYLSSQGESSESPWTDPVFMTGGNTEIKISVRSVTTAYDPTASLERMRDPKTDTLLPSSRGVARCVYAKISFNETLEYHHLGIFADQFDETEKLVSGQSGSATIVVTNMEET